VGSGDPPEADHVVELPGTTIIPGFIDAHVHLTGTGAQRQTPEVTAARSARQMLDALGATLRKHSGPVVVQGWDETRWDAPQVPDVHDLDALTDRPVAAVRVDGHLSIANTAALRESKVLDADGVERDASGDPTGRVTRVANQRLRQWFHRHLSDHDVETLQLEASSLAVAHGVTCVHEMLLPAERGLRDFEILRRHRGRLPLDVVMYLATTDIAQVMDLGLAGIGGDLPVDGSIGARTAWVSEPFVEGEGSGVGYFEDHDLASFFRNSHLAGLQVGVHAIGDAAIDQVVRVWEQVYRSLDSRGRRHFRARRHRIEHFEMAGDEVIERAAGLGLAVSVQPSFDTEWGHPGGLYETGLGWDRAWSMNPFRSLLERGLEVGAGSDSPITTIDPMVGITAFEWHHEPSQRLSRGEAIRAYTVGSARLAHLEEKKGALAAGMHADFAAYDVDPTETPSLEGVRPVLTVSMGRDVFAA
jgi:predicted amidohydrolase YtcJ